MLGRMVHYKEVPPAAATDRARNGPEKRDNWIDYSEGGVPSTVGVPATKALEDRRRGDSNCGTAEHG